MFYKISNSLYLRNDQELLCIEGWGEGLRVRSVWMKNSLIENDFGLLPKNEIINRKKSDVEIKIHNDFATITNDKVSCKISLSGKLIFYNQHSDILLEEYDRNRFRKNNDDFNSALEINPRTFRPISGTDNHYLTVRFESDPDEKIFGMGQYQQNNLNVKGCILELAQRNSQTSIPFALSSKGYGILWNNPSIGKVVFGNNLTEWESYSTKQMDYWIVAGDSPAEIVEKYTEVVGRVPMMPDYGLGFWQCKLRYQTQEELLNIAKEYSKRDIPLSVIVIDYFHWLYQGDWEFDPQYWPDPKGMVDELNKLGIKLMVSVWPTVEENSKNYNYIKNNGFLIATDRGNRMSQLGRTAFMDMTNPDARKYLWNKLKNNYYEYGIRIFWLDEAEPEFTKYEYEHYRNNRGSFLETGNIYPRDYAQMAYEGMRHEGQENILNLIRSAWVGSQKYGALLWSGDIDSSFRALRHQLTAGLNVGIAGIPWWTSDIGGFHGGNINDSKFIECLIRWFQFGAFCPVFRLHGDRDPHKEPLGTPGGGMVPSGADNEIWSYGESAYLIFKKYILLREKMYSYLKHTMYQAHKSGAPVMRTLFFNFPNDIHCWNIDDQFFLGDDILVCPILNAGQREREVYFPENCSWRDINTGIIYEGGKKLTLPAPISSIPVFVKNNKWKEINLEGN